ncbi:hypothetical protein [Flavobacterium sp.]|jgi:hypothetical protein|uniref:hypothetical protein n=1 Tax=Flavobacterium sp. TaxID=239 RepID=UPI002A81FEDC|nr:hypothetical protein [Flavobacterium sp.]
MTKIITFITLLLVSTLWSQTNYEKEMQDALTTWQDGNSNEAIAKFEKIALVEKKSVLPSYYVSLINTTLAFKTKDFKEMNLFIQKAQKAQDEVNKFLPDDPEVLVLQAMIHTASIVYDPLANGRQLSAVVLNIYKMAEGIAPNNPRVVLSKAEFEIGMAEYFGQDTKPMCEQIAKSIELFANFKPESKFHPTWGIDKATKAIQNCK